MTYPTFPSIPRGATRMGRGAPRPTRLALFAAIMLAGIAPAMAGEVCDTTGPKTSKAQGGRAVACGYRNNARGAASSALGYDNDALGKSSTAVGAKNRAIRTNSSAVGSANSASGTSSSAVGYKNNARGSSSSAIGASNTAAGSRSIAAGYDNATSGTYSSAVGARNSASGTSTSAVGDDNTALGSRASAIGYGNTAGNTDSIAVGVNNAAMGQRSSAFGYHGTSAGAGSAALAGFYDRDGNGVLTLDVDTNGDGVDDASSESAVALGTGAIAVGAGVVARGEYSAAFGANASANADYSTAIGFGAVADREYTLSVGATGSERQIVNVAAGTQGTDAVNVAQLAPFATALGGGASFAGGVFIAPTYVVQAGSYRNVGAAFSAIDGELSAIKSRADLAVYYDDADHDVITLDGDANAAAPAPADASGGTRVGNVADGVAAGDAVNKGQLDAGDAATLRSSRTYTDTTATQTLTSANAYTDAKVAAWDDQFDTLRDDVDQRFGEQGQRINTVVALSAALALAAPDGRVQGANQVSMGVGHYRNQQAVSIGYSRLVSPRASVRVAAAFADGENAAGVGLNVGW